MKERDKYPLLAQYEKRDMLIPWSGGCDSTLLVIEALRAGHKVRTIGYNSKLIAASARQRTSRQVLRATIQSRFGHWTHDEIRMDSTNTAFLSKGDFGNPQAFYWTVMSLVYGRPSDLVAIAWIDPDSFVWQNIASIKQLFELGTRILDSKAILYLPFEHYSKVKILQRLRELRFSTKDMWWCQEQSLVKSATCTCQSCSRYRQALTEVRFLEKRQRP